MKKKKPINWTKLILELIVVFLGVTAGFVLQNLKESSAQKAQEVKYIEGFQADLTDNIESIDRLLKKDDEWLNSTTWTVQFMETDTFTADSANALLSKMVAFENFTSQKSTYSNITNSGNLNIISDFDVRQAIIKYHQELEDFDYLDKFFQNHIQNQHMPFIRNHYDVFSQSVEPEGFYKTLEFRNTFRIFYSLKQQRWQQLDSLKVQSLEYQTLLKDYKASF